MAVESEDDEFVERRQNGGLTDDQIAQIREAILASVYEDIGRSLVRKAIWALGAILASVYEDIGRSLVRKAIWALGAVFAAVLTWVGANHVQIKW